MQKLQWLKCYRAFWHCWCCWVFSLIYNMCLINHKQKHTTIVTAVRKQQSQITSNHKWLKRSWTCISKRVSESWSPKCFLAPFRWLIWFQWGPIAPLCQSRSPCMISLQKAFQPSRRTWCPIDRRCLDRILTQLQRCLPLPLAWPAMRKNLTAVPPGWGKTPFLPRSECYH